MKANHLSAEMPVSKVFYSSHSQPRHREVVGRALLSCSLIFGADMIECG